MNLSLSLSAVFPILAFMLLGALLNRLGRLSANTQAEMNKIIFNWLFPLVMFSNIYRTSLGEVLNLPFLLALVGLVLAASLIVILVTPRFIKDRRQLGSMVQGIIRGNSMLFALPVVSAISGPENTGLASLCVAIVVPVVNIICVIVLEALRGEKLRPAKLLVSILKNPLIFGALAGLLFKALGLRLPQMVAEVVYDLAGMVTPLALIMLGAGLKFSDTLGYRAQLAAAAAAKLLLMPLFIVLAIKLMGFGKPETTVALALAAVPTAVSTFVMAKEMGADGVLAGQIVATTTVLSVFTVFLWVLALSGLNWIG